MTTTPDRTSESIPPHVMIPIPTKRHSTPRNANPYANGVDVKPMVYYCYCCCCFSFTEIRKIKITYILLFILPYRTKKIKNRKSFEDDENYDGKKLFRIKFVTKVTEVMPDEIV